MSIDEQKRILVTAAGSGPGVSLVKAIRRQSNDRDFVLAVDVVPAAAGLYLANESAIVPKAKEANYVDRLLELCRRHRIGMLIPILDLETAVLASQRDRFAAVGVALAVNPADCVANANDKLRSYETCERHDILQPKRFETLDAAPAEAYPLIGKPPQGVGSLGIIVLTSPQQRSIVSDDAARGLIWQEFIQGDEFSVDTFGRPSAKWFFAVPRHRRLIKAGQMVQGTTVNDPALIEFAGKICDAFGTDDVGCVQIIRRGDGRLYFIELNSRYGTGVSLSIAAGVNFPLVQWLYYKTPERIDASLGEFKDGLEMLRYWEEVYRETPIKN